MKDQCESVLSLSEPAACNAQEEKKCHGGKKKKKKGFTVSAGAWLRAIHEQTVFMV